MLREHHDITLLKLRQQVGLTQRELAEALGVTQKTISIWERGKMQPKLSFWQTKLMMEKLNCTLDQLIIATELKHQNHNEIKSTKIRPHNPRFF
ncbi:MULTISPECIES: helix-turn-helix transcriptional regulator [Moorena]|uniref:Putative transcriptional regulator, CBS domain family n=1 Tax=Moorena producens 3L TaxID=489825 RepID=F4XNS2_9CYAN|nr:MULTISPECIES: helix-turn-helix transcriptional regulator [Moorena]NES82302.1 helix-turn-helix transcriptional regulator [Moorena sp. SIO2B7]EGJ33693.1 putative transcriptional regulator, CBS domain family [Moorena producens 3L]NEP33549.1 helix-turn-helix transcriptional regulator [Moorena sp. SIO3B2]NEP68012.1 helix-turn-helix transcriptional regulator [Moorena sp. SIO3A5]NEQ09623.1 helix-turn-helix transcriptional regulator [Moorena sp. SIO4E2]